MTKQSARDRTNSVESPHRFDAYRDEKLNEGIPHRLREQRDKLRIGQALLAVAKVPIGEKLSNCLPDRVLSIRPNRLSLNQPMNQLAQVERRNMSAGCAQTMAPISLECTYPRSLEAHRILHKDRSRACTRLIASCLHSRRTADCRELTSLRLASRQLPVLIASATTWTRGSKIWSAFITAYGPGTTQRVALT